MKRKTTLAVLAAVIALCGLAVACQARGSLGGVIAPSGSDAGEYSESAEYSDGVSTADHDASGAGASEEEWPGQSQGFVGPNGEGAINRDDYSNVDEYDQAFTALDGVENEAPRTPIEEGEAGYGYYEGILCVSFNRSCGELRAHEIVWERGGTWCSDTFQWPDRDGTASSVIYFEGLADRPALESMAEELAALDEVASAYPDTWFKSQAATDSPREGRDELAAAAVSSPGYTPSDTEIGNQYYLERCRFYEAWHSARCEKSTCIAVLDSGIDFDHPELQGNIDAAHAKNALVQGDFAGGDEDGTGHGTMVSGVAAGVANNAAGIAGCSFNSMVLPVRVVGDDGSASWEAVRWALSYLLELGDAPDVVNMSFAGPAGSFSGVVQQTQIATLVQLLRASRGTVLVAASGNTDEDDLMYPAAFAGVVSVAGTDESGSGRWGAGAGYGHGSTHNSKVDVAAPAEDVYTTVYQSTSADIPCDYASGTSLASPQVAAVAALVKKKHPAWGASDIEGAITGGASDIGSSGRDDEFGAGLLDAKSSVDWTPPTSSPFTGPSGDMALSELQAAAQRRPQATGPEGIPAALGRAMAVNPDVWAWLHVPGTSVSVPVARRGGDGDFYLTHDSHGNPSPIGCAFAHAGADDPGGPVTALYGHSFSAGDLAFTSLHAFEDRGFFAAHGEAYLYVPGRVYEYRVTGANPFNARAIEDVDQTDPDDLASYFGELSSPDPSRFLGLKRDVRLDPARDRVLQLSTCTVPTDPARRFVVTCALVGEKEL